MADQKLPNTIVQKIATYKPSVETIAIVRSTTIFVLPPSYEVWQQRLINRYQGNIDEADYAQRMATARVELRRALTTGYFYYLINGDLDTAATATDALVILNQIDPDAQEQAHK